MHVTPNRRIAIHVSVAVDVFEVNTIPFGDDEGIFFDIVLHLGKRVPDDAVVEVFEVLFLLFGHICRVVEKRKSGFVEVETYNKTDDSESVSSVLFGAHQSLGFIEVLVKLCVPEWQMHCGD